MDINCPVSFLSQNVWRNLVDIGKHHIKNQKQPSHFINNCLTINWEKIQPIFSLSGDFSIHDQEPEWFHDKIDKLWPCILEAHYALLDTPLNILRFESLCEWTSHQKEIWEYFQLFFNSEVSSIEGILFLTAVLERSLGNLFLLKGKAVPSLLRDLLSTTEMNVILSEVQVVFLQILMGTPLALNLRNIAWHGFPSQDELYPQYVSTLFVVILSIGELLNQRNIDLHMLRKRPQIELSDRFFPSQFPFLKVHNYYEGILDIFSRSLLIPTSHFSYWKQALDYHISGKQGQSMLLLLPQLEHMLRHLYCKTNNCPERILTAESASLYTTLNEIMSENVIDENGRVKKNALVEIVGERVIEMLQDTFIHPAGPRIRDKMSHGECYIHGIPDWIVNHLVVLGLVITVSDIILEGTTYKEENIADKGLQNYVVFLRGHYESVFHPSSILKTAIKQCVFSLNTWFVHEDLEISCYEVRNRETELSTTLKLVKNCIHLNVSVLNPDNISSFVESLKIHIVFRHKYENEMINLLRQVMENIQQISNQVKQNLEEKYSQYRQHLLRSRQRDTFQRMVLLIPKLKEVLFFIISVSVLCLQSVNNICSLSEKEFELLMKFCRTILQFVQNVSTLTKCDKNRWMEIEMLATTVTKVILKYTLAPFFKHFYFKE